MAKLPLTFACWNYDRIHALSDGSVEPEGIDLTCLDVFPAETFQRMVKYREFELAELGLKFYVSTLEREDRPFVALPVFPVRLFLHSAAFVHRGSGIASPADLAGKRVGELFAYGHDAAIWLRGILADRYGLAIESPTYVTGGLDARRQRDFAPFPPPPFMRVEAAPAGYGLDEMLERGDLDALYSAIVPPSLLRGSPNVGRLFDDYESVERAYYRETGIFPIVHLVALRRDVYERHPWIAQSLYKAFKAAKARAYRLYAAQAANMHRLFMAPWLSALQERNRALMGDDPWPYGLEPNRDALDAFLRYHHEQGLSKRRFTPDELFAPETLVDYADFS